MLDVFSSSPFLMSNLTDAVNKLPHVPGRLGAMNLFEESGVTTTKITIEEKNGVLYLVPSLPRGAPPTPNRTELRKARQLTTVHLPTRDRIMADELQDVREFGSDTVMVNVQTVINERLTTMRGSLEATLEHLRVGAIKGVVLDSDGATTLYNLFTTFDVTKEPIAYFDLSDGAPTPGELRQRCSNIIRTIEDHLGAASYDHIHSMVGPTFMDRLADHPETREAYQRWQDGAALRDQVARRSFAYAGITFEEYRGKVNSMNYISPTAAHFFPVGVPGLFRTVFAPANYTETVNTSGLPLYVKSVADPAQRWTDLHAQMNPLPYCTRPSVLIEGSSAAAP